MVRFLSIHPEGITRAAILFCCPDISLAVFHKRANRPRNASRSELVNNRAASTKRTLRFWRQNFAPSDTA
jgi:hypothetical protein